MADAGKREVWIRRMAAWTRSGLSRRAWCGKHGLNVHTFDYWRRRLRAEPKPRRGRRSTGKGLVPIVVAPALAVAAVELRLPDGLQLSIPPGADPAQVAALIRALQEC